MKVCSQCSQSSRCANSRSPGRLEDEQRVLVAPRGSSSPPVHGPGSGSEIPTVWAHHVFHRVLEPGHELGSCFHGKSWVRVQTPYPKHTHPVAGLNLF